MKPIEVFQEEIATISDPRIQDLVTDVLQKLVQANMYFYKAPASSSKQHHPACCNVKSGLLRHVKRAVGIGHHLCTAYGLPQRDRDVVTAALILHDIWKNDFQRHSSRAAAYVMETIGQNADKYGPIGALALADIVRAIRRHMGLWTEVGFRVPISEYSLVELVVYTADYISSRSDIGMVKQDSCALPEDFPGEDLVKAA